MRCGAMPRGGGIRWDATFARGPSGGWPAGPAPPPPSSAPITVLINFEAKLNISRHWSRWLAGERSGVGWPLAAPLGSAGRWPSAAPTAARAAPVGRRPGRAGSRRRQRWRPAIDATLAPEVDRAGVGAHWAQ